MERALRRERIEGLCELGLERHRLGILIVRSSNLAGGEREKKDEGETPGQPPRCTKSPASPPSTGRAYPFVRKP
jgi:hypothetical protein